MPELSAWLCRLLPRVCVGVWAAQLHGCAAQRPCCTTTGAVQRSCCTAQHSTAQLKEQRSHNVVPPVLLRCSGPLFPLPPSFILRACSLSK